MKSVIQKKNYVENWDKNHVLLYVTSGFILTESRQKLLSSKIIYVISTLTILEVKNQNVFKLYKFISENRNLIKVDLNGIILFLAKKTLKNFESLDKSIHYMTACHYNCFGII